MQDKKPLCAKCNDTGEFITGLDGKEYPGDSGVEPAGGGSLHECGCDSPENYDHEYGKFRDWWDETARTDPIFHLIDTTCRQGNADRADAIKLLVGMLFQKIRDLQLLITNK